MDQFGVFTESYGLKPQGKSAPMAAKKRQGSSNGGVNSGFNAKSASYSSTSTWNSSSPNGGFGSDQKSPNYGGDGYDDLFGAVPMFSKPSDDQTSKSSSSFDYDSIFGGSNQSGAKSSPLSGYDSNDIFGGVLGMNSSASSRNNGVFASFPPPPNQNSTGFDDLLGSFGGVAKSSSRNGDDLLGNYGGVEAQSKSSGRNGSTGDAAGLYDWVDEFGRSSPSKNRVNMQTSQPRQASKTTFMKSEDPFIVLESTSNSAYSSELFSNPPRNTGNLNFSGGTKISGSSNPSATLRPPPKPLQVVKPDKGAASFSEQKKTMGSSISAIDELQDFAMGRAGNNYNEEKIRTSAVSKKEINESTGIRERQNAKASKYKVVDAATQEQKGEDDLESFFSMATRSRSAPKSRAATSVMNSRQPEVAQRTSSGSSSSSIKKASSATNLVDDLSSVFGASPIFGEFEEVEGESEERRRARLGRIQRTQERAAKALADMNQRDLQTQREQDEKYRIAEAVDFEIKRWAAGKENNMRALLSSLHYVLWPECGWQPVSLTDMITSTSVKKVYRKATLCIHPDKVQQKGATLQQKYTAEKVFDILKEAWNKFNKEELS